MLYVYYTYVTLINKDICIHDYIFNLHFSFMIILKTNYKNLQVDLINLESMNNLVTITIMEVVL